MCGLLGVSTPGNKTVPLSKIKILYLMNEVRGGHACGFSDGKHTIKTTDKSFDFVASKEFPEEIKSFIGHTRFATHGNKSDISCAHPFDFDDFVGAHNGTIRNFKLLQEVFDTDYTVDSEFIYYLLDTYGLKKILPLFQGSLALSYIKKKSKEINIYRFGRTLFFGDLDDCLFYSSEERFLKAIGCKNIREVHEHTHYKLKNGKIASCKQIKKDLMPTADNFNRVVTLNLKHRKSAFEALGDDEVMKRYEELYEKKEAPKPKKEKTSGRHNKHMTLVPNPNKKPKKQSLGCTSNPVNIPAYAKAKSTEFAGKKELTWWWFDQDDATKVHIYIVGEPTQNIYNFDIASDVRNFETEHPHIQDVVEAEFNDIIESRSLIDQYSNETVHN